MAAITAVQDRLDLDASAYKALRGITGSSLDALIALALDAAKVAADDYCGNPFLARRTYGDDDGDDFNFDGLANWDGNRIDAEPGTVRLTHGLPRLRATDAAELNIPSTIKLGVIAYVDAVLDAFATAGSTPGDGSRPAAPVTSEKVGELARTYLRTSELGTEERQSFLGKLGLIAETYWAPYRLEAGF